jgi:ABC-type lipoprotein release transport system permease subunit
VRRLPIALLVQLAWANLVRHRGIAILLCLAVAAGVAFQVPNAANLAGYEAELVEQGTRAGLGDVRVRPREGSWLVEADALAGELAKRPGVVGAVPAFVLPGAIGKRGNFKPALILGIDEHAAYRPFHVIAGTGVKTGDTTGVAVGTTIATRDTLAAGDEVEVAAIFGAGEQATSLDDNLGRYTMKVRGITAGTFLGSEAIVVDRGLLAEDLGRRHAASMIFVHLRDHAVARAAASAIERDYPDVQARAWADDTPFLKSALAGSSAIRFVSGAMVVLAVSIPVWALLYVDVLHRRRQIAICNALGFRRRDMFLIYLAQAAMAGLIGIAVGCALGYALIAWFAGHPIFQSADFVIRPATTAWTFIGPSVTLFGATLVASVVPAWRAARLAPARILRGAE